MRHSPARAGHAKVNAADSSDRIGLRGLQRAQPLWRRGDDARQRRPGDCFAAVAIHPRALLSAQKKAIEFDVQMLVDERKQVRTPLPDPAKRRSLARPCRSGREFCLCVEGAVSGATPIALIAPLDVPQMSFQGRDWLHWRRVAAPTASPEFRWEADRSGPVAVSAAIPHDGFGTASIPSSVSF